MAEIDGVWYWTAVERLLDDPGPEPQLQGGVTVRKGDEILAELAFTPGTPSQSLDGLYDLKVTNGQCWNFTAQRWAQSCG